MMTNHLSIPGKFGHKNIKIATDVTDSELPLFLSKKENENETKQIVDAFIKHWIAIFWGNKRDFFFQITEVFLITAYHGKKFVIFFKKSKTQLKNIS